MGRLEQIGKRRDLINRLRQTALGVLDDGLPSVKPSALSGDGTKTVAQTPPVKKTKGKN